MNCEESGQLPSDLEWEKAYDESIYLPRMRQHYNSIQKKRDILP